MIEWDKDLVAAIARRRCVIVIGAGVSRNSQNAQGKRPSTWEEFLRNCAQDVRGENCIEDLLQRKDYLTACEVIKNKLTNDVFINKVQREYQLAAYKPADIHKHIYNLDVSIVASPNFDSIYDNYASAVSSGSVLIKDHTSQDTAFYLLGGENRLILKTHGSANTPQQLIFTRQDYAEARTKYVLFYEILKSLILTHTFLFLGCGTDDPDIRMLFEDVQFAHGRTPFHFMTVPAGEVHSDVLSIASRSMRINFIEYSPADGHVELTNSLLELTQRVDDYRATELKETLKW